MTIATSEGAQKLSRNVWKYVGYGAAALIGVGIYNAATSGPSCKFGTVSVRSETFYNNGLDYGFIVTAPVENTGSSGPVVVNAQLSTSQGTFERRTRYHLQKGEVTRVQFDFSEPTISVGNNVRAFLSCD